MVRALLYYWGMSREPKRGGADARHFPNATGSVRGSAPPESPEVLSLSDARDGLVTLHSEVPIPSRITTRPRRESVLQTSLRGVLLAQCPGELLIQPDKGSLARLTHRFGLELNVERLLGRRISLDLMHGTHPESPYSDLRLWDEDGRLGLWALNGAPPKSTPLPGVRISIAPSISGQPLLEVRAPRLRTLLSPRSRVRVPSAIRSFEVRVTNLREDLVCLVATPI
jgi:hypothetical protein